MNEFLGYQLNALTILVALGALGFAAHWLWRRWRGDSPSLTGEPTAEPVLSVVSSDLAARRAICLGALLARGELEQTIAATREIERPALVKDALTDFRDLAGDLKEWLRAEGLWESLSHEEQERFEKRLGSWTERDRIDVSWRSDALIAILWALRVKEDMPPYDQEAGDLEPVRTLSLLKSSQEFLSSARLRPDDEIARGRDIAEAWLWRARTTTLAKDPSVPKDKLDALLSQGYSLEKLVAMAAEYWEQQGCFHSIRNDYPALGKAYSELTDDEVSMMQSIATERLHALNWLCGHGDDWDTIRRDT